MVEWKRCYDGQNETSHDDRDRDRDESVWDMEYECSWREWSKCEVRLL